MKVGLINKCSKRFFSFVLFGLCIREEQVDKEWITKYVLG